jgi:hypothetical protein
VKKNVSSVAKSKLIVLTLAALLLSVQTIVSQDYSGYHSYNDMTKELKGLVNSNKSIAKIESIGKTIEGRDIWLLTIGSQQGTLLDERPGMLISANFEGDHLIGSEISLTLINYLLENYNSDEAVKKSIDEHVYYIIPRINPDGAERMFNNLKTGRKTNMSPYDGDNDGRMDEDGPDDLNKDGLITMMRVKDENGIYMIDPDEPRLMKKADPQMGETGTYSIYWEGIDNDNDGFINEDPVGGVDINRNFQHEYPYFKDDAGWHMVSEKESLALMSWVIKQRNIAIMLSFGESDNLIIPPNAKGILNPAVGIDLFNMANNSYSDAAKVGMVNTEGRSRYGSWMRMGRGRQDSEASSGGRQRPSRTAETTFGRADLEYFNKASEKYKELTGISKQPPLRDPSGAFFQYGYFQFGVLSFSTPGWGINDSQAGPADRERPGANERSRAGADRARVPGMTPASGSTGKGMDRDFITYLDNKGINGFVEWNSYTHPEFGEVEIGGFTPYEINNPPASEIERLGEAHGEFAVWLSGLYAKVQIAKTEVINHGGGLFRIKAEIENSGFLPTSLFQGVTSRSVKPTMVQLEVEPEAIISGSSKTSFFQSLNGSGNRQKYEWLIKGKAGDKIDLKVVAQKAGTDRVSITLK